MRIVNLFPTHKCVFHHGMLFKSVNIFTIVHEDVINLERNFHGLPVRINLLFPWNADNYLRISLELC